jgi:hypothetical protein
LQVALEASKGSKTRDELSSDMGVHAWQKSAGSIFKDREHCERHPDWQSSSVMGILGRSRFGPALGKDI